MNISDLKEWLVTQATMAKIDQSLIANTVDSCTNLGVAEFWTSRKWRFRRYEYTLAITARASSYALPDLFESCGIVKEQESMGGAPLTFYAKDQFDRMFPDVMSFATGYPQAYTVFRESGDNAYKIRFFPAPSSGDVIIDIFKKAGDVADIPDHLTSGVMWTCGKYLYPVGSEQWANMVRMAKLELDRLETEDSSFGERQHQFLTEGETTVTWSVPWA